MKKCFIILAFLFMGLVFAEHGNAMTPIRHLHKSIVNTNTEIKMNNNIHFSNVKTNISNSYSLNNQSKKIIKHGEITPDFIGLKDFLFMENSTLTSNIDSSSNSYRIRYLLNPRAP